MFVRDFPYGDDIDENVLDQDITNAFVYVNASGQPNPALFSDQASYSLGYLLLAAHALVENIRASSQGLNGQYNFLQASKGAGPINESFSIPQQILDHPILSMLTKTNYGSRYLQLVLPQLSGQVIIAHGTTLP